MSLQTLSRLKEQPKNQEYNQARADMDSVVLNLMKEVNIEATVIFNSKKEVVYATDKKYEQQRVQLFIPDIEVSAIDNVKTEIYITDIYIDKMDNNFDFLVIAPILDHNILLGKVMFIVNVQNLYEVIQQRIGTYKTSEVLIGRRVLSNSGDTDYPYNEKGDSVLYLNPLRFDPTAAFRKRVEIGGPLGEPIQAAVRGNSGTGIAVDYRGKQVLSVWRYLPEQKWGLVTKIDLEELLLPVNTVLEVVLLFSAITVVLIILIAWLLARGISLPIQKLTGIAQGLGEGELDIKIGGDLTSSANEVGILARTLSESAAKLRNYYKDLDQKVEEQTKEIVERSNDMRDQRKAILNVLEDVEEEKTKVLLERDRIDAILHSIGEGVVTIDKNGIILLLNSAAEKMLHIKAGEAVGKSYHDYWWVEDEDGKKVLDKHRPAETVLRTRKELVDKLHFFVNKNVRIPVSITVAPIIFKDELIGVVDVFQDITLEKNVDRMKTEFISMVAHQLRTPLSAIKWFIEILGGTKLDKEQKECSDNISAASNSMASLVNALLNISRIESGRLIVDPKLTDLKALVGEIAKELAPELTKKKLQLSIDIKTLPKIKIDPKLIREVYINLLTNAIKYSPEKGKISITISKKDDDIISEISDTGFGIPKAEQEKVFQKFYRGENILKKEPTGNGLGLYLVKSIMDVSGGKIWFKSEIGKGTKFSFSLPLAGSPKKEGQVTLS